MTAEYIALDSVDLLVATLLVVLAGVVSVILKLQLIGRLGVAAIRTVIQLTLIGYVLRYVFELSTFWAVGAVMVVMLAAASRASVQRSERTYQNAVGWAFLTLVVSSLLTTFVVTKVVIGVQPWYRPQYLIPLLGMVLGNALTGISLCLDSLLEHLRERRALVETELSLGASRWEAAREPLQQAVRRGLIPIINSMTVVGLVSLPGMMTGQILAGADPLEAVKYQIVVMFMIAAATSLGSMGIAVCSCTVLFNKKHQLLYRRITTR